MSISAQLAPLDRTNPWRPSTTGVSRLADSLTALGDTAQALERLQQSLAKNRTDADAWHRYGLLLWQSTGAARRAGYSANLEGIRMLSRADTAPFATPPRKNGIGRLEPPNEPQIPA